MGEIAELYIEAEMAGLDEPDWDGMVEEQKKERISCRTHCIYWNSIDKDCELYGENHPRPRNCMAYLDKGLL